MSYKFVTVNGRENLRMTEIICDTENDLADIPIEKLEMGSTVYVIATGKIQTLASDGTWTVKGNADGITDADLADLAGAGRTTETVKGNADEIADHIAGGENPHAVTLAQLGAAANADLADLAGAGRTVETIKGNADEIADHITDNENPHTVTLTQLGAAATDHTHAYVPTTRTVNGKALSANITLTAADVGAAADADLADLAGAGRTTETIKGNADEIVDHIIDDENPHMVTLEQLGAAANADLSNLAGSGRTTETVKGNADALDTALGAALSTLTTTAKTLVEAINEINTALGDLDGRIAALEESNI